METDRRGQGGGWVTFRWRDYFVRPLLKQEFFLHMHDSFSTLFFLQHEFLLIPSYHFFNGASLTFIAGRFSVLVSIKNHCKPRYMFSPLKSGLYLSVGVLRTICV